MKTICYSMVRGSAMRITGLTSRGGLPDTIPYVISRAISVVTINEVVASGGNELIKNDEDEARLHFVTPDQTIRYTADINFLRVDPGMLSLITGVPIVYDYKGNVVGFDANTRLPAASFAMELWSKIAGQSCGTSVHDGLFGVGPFGYGGIGVDLTIPSGPQYGYTLFPFLKGGYLGGFTFADGLMSFSVKGAKVQRGSKWGYGPYPLDTLVQRLYTPVSGNLNFRQYIAQIPPPDQTDGISYLTDIIDGGSASSTSADILDGGTASTTTSDIIDGGSAA